MHDSVNIVAVKTPEVRKVFSFQAALSAVLSFEFVFGFFLLSSRIKATPALSWIPFDLTGASLAVLSVCGGWILARRRFRLHGPGLLVVAAGVLFLGYAAGSMAWSPGVNYASEKAVYLLTVALWPMIAAGLIIAYEPERLKRFLFFIVMGALILAGGALVSYIQQPGGFVQVFGGRYLGVGRFASIGASILLGFFFLFRADRAWKVLAAATLVPLLVSILIIGARGPAIALILSALVPVAAAVFVPRYRKAIVFGAVTLFVGAAIFFTQVDIPLTIQRLFVLLEPQGGASAGARMEFYRHALAFWEVKPVFGFGAGSWPILYLGEDVRAYPHNLYLEVVVETGLVGFLLLSVWMLVAFRTLGSWQQIRTEPMRLLLLMCFVNLFFNALVSGDLTDNRLFFFILACMAIRLPDRAQNFRRNSTSEAPNLP